jgi:hypothetical protein
VAWPERCRRSPPAADSTSPCRWTHSGGSPGASSALAMNVGRVRPLR